jgi:hypothetical protein
LKWLIFRRRRLIVTVMRSVGVSMLPLPELLLRLIDSGVWPSSNGPSMTRQQLKPLFTEENVRRFAKEESLICLQPHPFPTVASERDAGGAGDFWERFGALHQIDPKMAVIIGDFGLGSDAPIVLDYSRNAVDPPVMRLRWGPNQKNEWVQGAQNFREFASILGLADKNA